MLTKRLFIWLGITVTLALLGLTLWQEYATPPSLPIGGAVASWSGLTTALELAAAGQDTALKGLDLSEIRTSLVVFHYSLYPGGMENPIARHAAMDQPPLMPLLRDLQALALRGDMKLHHRENIRRLADKLRRYSEALGKDWPSLGQKRRAAQRRYDEVEELVYELYEQRIQELREERGV